MLFRRMPFFFIIALALVGHLLAGCGGSHGSRSSEDPVLTAYRLIDEDRTDEAIALMEREFDQDPDNLQYRVTLASAYAHKGGIRIQKLIPTINKADKFKELEERIAEVSADESVSTQVNNNVLNLASMLVKFSGFIEVYASIPVISVEQASYLKHAIFLLSEEGVDFRKRDVFYRAIVEVVLFKHLLAENLIGEFVADSRDKNKPPHRACTIDLGHVNDTIVQLGKLLIDIFNDLGIADKSQAKRMQYLTKEVAHTVNNLTIGTTSLIVLDEASNIFLQETLIQHDFGKLIKCQGD